MFRDRTRFCVVLTPSPPSRCLYLLADEMSHPAVCVCWLTRCLIPLSVSAG